MKNIVLIAAILIAGLLPSGAAAAGRPNIVFVITDDQGYGDLGHTGNPVIRTPHIDSLAAESSQLTDYHVAPTCSPTRAALLTGHWTNRTGVWHTVNGRSMLRENEVTLAQMLKDAGYATGLFGKWHLGDNFPYRPEDRGFMEVYRHGGGGVGQTPDLWDNACFDGRYFHNGRVVEAKGFCTDVFFEQARRFITEQAMNERPFFAYISTNAPHGPLHAPQNYMDMYSEQEKAVAAFYGMITNIDDNVGSTRQLLRDLGIEQNTLFIFTTDNGTASGAKIFNAGMRGAKGSEYEGGHRVPFIAHWPAVGWNRKHVSHTLCHAVDIVPTLLEIAGVNPPDAVTFDGLSIRPLLAPSNNEREWPGDRILVTDSQRVRDPVKWKQTSVMSGPWRLVNGVELYDIRNDPGQQKNIMDAHAEQATRMIAFYDTWWNELSPSFEQTTEIILGHPDHPVVSLTGHDWIQEELPPWNQQHIRQAEGFARSRRGEARGNETPSSPSENSPKTIHRGHWAVKVVTAGRYEISLRRWPAEADHPITAAIPPGETVPGASRPYRAHQGVAIPAVTATLRLNGQDRETKPIRAGDKSITFSTALSPGSYEFSPVFTTEDGQEVGAYYAVITTQP